MKDTIIFLGGKVSRETDIRCKERSVVGVLHTNFYLYTKTLDYYTRIWDHEKVVVLSILTKKQQQQKWQVAKSVEIMFTIIIIIVTLKIDYKRPSLCVEMTVLVVDHQRDTLTSTERTQCVLVMVTGVSFLLCRKPQFTGVTIIVKSNRH